MTSPDMDVLKEIPGYKVIFKAIVKSQIQQLVEQLAAHTEEESIILTASVSDGTLSHLGSDSGKSFLEDHEDVKSQFLGFCLKFHHKKKQEQERKEQEEQQRQLLARQQQQQQQFSPRGPGFMGRSPGMQFSPRFSSPRHMMRSPGARQEPYPLTRPIRRTALNFGARGRGGPGGPPIRPPVNNQVIKIEAEDPDDPEANQSRDSTTQGDNASSSSHQASPSHSATTPTNIKTENADKDDDAKSNSSSSTIPNEASEMRPSDSAPQEGLSFDSDLSGIASDPASTKGSGEDTEETGDVNVKLEAITESDMELEITGVEPGRQPAPSVSQESWTPNMDYEGGAMGSPADLPGADQRYRSFLRCEECGKIFASRSALNRHMPVHTGEKAFECSICGKKFNQKGNYKRHIVTHCS